MGLISTAAHAAFTTNQGKGTERMPGFHWFARTVRWEVHAGDRERIVTSSRGICMFNHFQSLLRPVNIIIMIYNIYIYVCTI